MDVEIMGYSSILSYLYKKVVSFCVLEWDGVGYVGAVGGGLIITIFIENS